MTLKAIFFSFSLLAVYPEGQAYAASKNLCDDMVASGKSTDAQIAKCIAKFGESDFYKENNQKKKWQEEVNAAKSAEDAYIRKTVFHNGILAFKNQKRIIKVGDSPSLS